MNAHVDEHSDHAVYAPSSADRWMNCTASAEAIANLPPQEEGEEATEGTEAHEEIERVLGPLSEGGMRYGVNLDNDHPAAYGVALVVDYVRKLPPGRLWVEQRVYLTEHIWGRCDISHWDESTATLTIVDYKNGFIGVDADAPQLLIYAAASIYTHKLPAKWIRLVVVQPNDFRPVPRVKQHVMSVDALYDFANKAAAVPLGPKTFTAGEHCRYCPLFGRCEPTRDLLRDLSALIAGLITPDQVRPEQRALFLNCKKPIEDQFKSAEKAWLKTALKSGAPDGMMLVTGDTRRAWVDEAAARAAIIAAKGYDALDLPTPAQAEKLGVDVSKLAKAPQGGPVLAMAGDKRKPWAAKTAAEMFGSVASK